MSFSYECKKEIMDSSNYDNCCLSSHLYGFLCFFPRISNTNLSFSSENPEIIEYLLNLFALNGIGITNDMVHKGKKVYSIKCEDPTICERILSDYFSINGRLQIRINHDLFLCHNCIKAFTAGAFLAAGIVSEPQKGYHLEFTTHRANVASDFYALLHECDFNMKASVRGYDNLIYVKDSETIEDLLTYIGAPNSSMKMMEAKIVRSVRNKVTRRVNCENANMNKAVSAAYKDIELIDRLFKHGGKKLLSKDLLKVADMRKKYPELNLNELANMTEEGLTKSGLSHRLRKIRSIANDYLNGNE